MGEIIPFPVWIIPFPVWIIPFPLLKIDLNTLEQMRNILQNKFFDPRPASGRNNFISCLDNSISCFKINFEPLGSNDKCFVKEVFLSEAWKWEK